MRRTSRSSRREGPANAVGDDRGDGRGTKRSCVAAALPPRPMASAGCGTASLRSLTVATRLLADGEHVIDAPSKLSARARVFATGQGRKTGATDAHSVARSLRAALPGRVCVGELDAGAGRGGDLRARTSRGCAVPVSVLVGAAYRRAVISASRTRGPYARRVAGRRAGTPLLRSG